MYSNGDTKRLSVASQSGAGGGGAGYGYTQQTTNQSTQQTQKNTAFGPAAGSGGGQSERPIVAIAAAAAAANAALNSESLRVQRQKATVLPPVTRSMGSGSLSAATGQGLLAEAILEYEAAVIPKLTTGAVFLKHGRSGAPHKRWVWVTQDLSTLRWSAKKTDKMDKDRSCPVEEIVGVSEYAFSYRKAVPGSKTPSAAVSGGVSKDGTPINHSNVAFCIHLKKRVVDLDVLVPDSPKDAKDSKDSKSDNSDERDEWVKAFRWLQGRATSVSAPFNVVHHAHVSPSHYTWTYVDLCVVIRLSLPRTYLLTCVHG